MSEKAPQILPLPQDVAAQLRSSTAISNLQQVVLGLLENALDAGAGKVQIGVDFRRGTCTVEDDGDGISPNEFSEHGGLGKRHCEMVWVLNRWSCLTMFRDVKEQPERWLRQIRSVHRFRSCIVHNHYNLSTLSPYLTIYADSSSFETSRSINTSTCAPTADFSGSWYSCHSPRPFRQYACSSQTTRSSTCR